MQYEVREKTVLEPQRELPVANSADVVIAGGGVAGFGAAIASARVGVKTILIENLGFLGGVATAHLMQNISAGPFMDGVMSELINRMADNGGATRWDTEKRRGAKKGNSFNEYTTFDVECYKETALEMCREAGVILYLYTKVCEPIMTGNTIAGVVVENKGGRSAIMGKRVLDCTGDGDLLFRAGVESIKGRPEDNKMRPFALLFRVGGIDFKKMLGYLDGHPDQWQAQYKIDPFQKIGDRRIISRLSGFFDLVKQAKSNGDLYEWIHYLRFEALFLDEGICLCNTSRVYNLDGTVPEDLTKGELIGRQQMGKLIKFMRAYVPGCENAFVIDAAPTIGVRETRRFIGDYFLTEEDVYSSKDFEDRIITAVRNMPIQTMSGKIDVHPVEPVEGAEDDHYERPTPGACFLAPTKYHLNYRMLLPKGVENMLFAGRTMSTTHSIEAFTRSMPWCMRLGNVAGAAAALSVKEGVSPRKLSFSKLKEALIVQGYTKF